MSKSIGNVVDPQLVIEVCSNAYSASIQSFFHLFHPFTPAEMFFFPAPLLKWLRSTQGGTQAPLPPPPALPPILHHCVLKWLLLSQGGKNAKEQLPYGADVLRLWVASVDYNSDVLIGGRIISQVNQPPPCPLSPPPLPSPPNHLLALGY